jgi:hypothetical protein
MLMTIAGKKSAKETAAKKPAARQRNSALAQLPQLRLCE